MTGREMELGAFLTALSNQIATVHAAFLEHEKSGQTEIAQLRVDLTNLTGRVRTLEARPVPPETTGRAPGCTCRVISGPHSPSCGLWEAFEDYPVKEIISERSRDETGYRIRAVEAEKFRTDAHAVTVQWEKNLTGDGTDGPFGTLPLASDDPDAPERESEPCINPAHDDMCPVRREDATSRAVAAGLPQAYGTPTTPPVGLRSVETPRDAERRIIGETCGPTEEIL